MLFMCNRCSGQSVIFNHPQQQWWLTTVVPVWCWTWRRTSCGQTASRSSLGGDWTEPSWQTVPPSRSPGGKKEGEGHSVDDRDYVRVCVRVCRYLHHRAGQDDAGAQGTLWVKALLAAVVGLSQRHGQRRLRVHLQGPGTHTHTSAGLVCWLCCLVEKAAWGWLLWARQTSCFLSVVCLTSES